MAVVEVDCLVVGEVDYLFGVVDYGGALQVAVDLHFRGTSLVPGFSKVGLW